MSGLDGNAIIDEVVNLTTAVRTDVTTYIQEFRDYMSKSDKVMSDFVDSTKNELEAKFKHYAETIQTSLIEYDLKNAQRTTDILNSNRLISVATIFSTGEYSSRESVVVEVFLLEKLISERNTVL